MNDPLLVGVIGAAGRGGSLGKIFHSHPTTRVHALCDINFDSSREGWGSDWAVPQAEEFGVDLIYSDAEEMLDKAGVDIAIIGTPMPLHVPQSLMALERGIHVFSEVPAGVNIAECKELVAAVKASSATYMMAENYCYIKPNVLIKELVEQGYFGELYFGEGEYVHELKEYNERTPWRRKWQTGINGNTYPTHMLGPVLEWFADRVTAVSCVGTGHHYQDPRGDYYENEDSTMTMCRLAKGGLVKLRLDMLSDRPHNLNYYSLQGTKGCYEAERGLGDQPKIWLADFHEENPPQWHPLADFEQDFLPEKWLNPPPEALEAGHWGGDYWEVDDFVQAIVNGTPPPVDIHRAMDMTLPGLVSQQSIQQDGAWLDVPNSREW